MEFVKAIDEIDEEFIQTLHSFLPESSHPPEDIDEDLVFQHIYAEVMHSTKQLTQAPEVIESRDFFALGQLLGEIISPFLTPLYIQTIQDNVSWKDLQSSLDIMCARNPDLRLSPRSVLGTTFFKDNVLIDIVETFKEIQGIQADIKRRLFR